MQTTDDEQCMQLALHQAQLALDSGNFPVGCVLVQENTLLQSGYRQNSEGTMSNEIDHAEMVTLRALLAKQPELDWQKITVYSTMEPCLMCYTTLLLSGVRRFVWAYEDVMGGGTNLPLDQLAPLYQEMLVEVELIPNILREQSLRLFGEFFQNYSYWQDSLIAEYTLSQHQNQNQSLVNQSPSSTKN